MTPLLPAQRDGPRLVRVGGSPWRSLSVRRVHDAAEVEDLRIAPADVQRVVPSRAAPSGSSPGPPDADPGEVTRRIVAAVDAPRGSRPFRVHIDPARDGAEEVYGVGERIRREFYDRIGLADLLTPPGPIGSSRPHRPGRPASVGGKGRGDHGVHVDVLDEKEARRDH